jgi:hypothetical protein
MLYVSKDPSPTSFSTVMKYLMIIISVISVYKNNVYTNKIECTTKHLLTEAAYRSVITRIYFDYQSLNSS